MKRKSYWQCPECGANSEDIKIDDLINKLKNNNKYRYRLTFNTKEIVLEKLVLTEDYGYYYNDEEYKTEYPNPKYWSWNTIYKGDDIYEALEKEINNK